MKTSVQGRVLVITMNSKTNSYTQHLLDTLNQTLEMAVTNQNLGSIILTSSSSVFSVGGDLKKMKEGVDQNQPTKYVNEVLPKIHELLFNIIEHPLPIITGLNGIAAGGAMGLFLAADYRIASEKGKLYTAFSDLALTPDSGSSILFPLRFGNPSIFHSFMQPTFFTAEQLIEQKAIHEVVKHDLLENRLLEVATKLADGDRWVNANVKKFSNRIVLKHLKAYLDDERNSIYAGCQRVEFAESLEKVINQLAKRKK